MTTVLLTNDDGTEAPGVAAMAAALRGAFDRVVAVTDDLAHVAAGTRLASGKARVVAARDGWWRLCSAPPGELVLAGLALLGEPPSVVVAGVNHGPNVGRTVLHSGTVGAALTAAWQGLPAVAVSCDDVHSTGGDENGPMHWSAAAAVGAALARYVASTGDLMALNLNVPNRPLHQTAGVVVVPLGSSRPVAFLHDDGRVGRRIDAGADTDAGWLRRGYCTVTSLPVPGAVDAAADVADIVWRSVASVVPGAAE